MKYAMKTCSEAAEYTSDKGYQAMTGGVQRMLSH